MLRPLLFLWACVLPVFSLPAQTQERQLDQVQQALLAADAARQALAAEQQAWVQQKEDMKLLLETLRLEERYLKQQAAQRAQRLAACVAEEAELLAAVQVQDLQALRDAVAAEFQSDCDHLQQRLMPEGLAPVSGDALARLLAALDALQERAAQVQLRVLTAQLDGQLQAIRVLQYGAVALWWCSLDAQRGGVASYDELGQLVLEERPEALPAIVQAMSMQQGHKAPAFVLLPLGDASP